jgi:hypothetical protein
MSQINVTSLAGIDGGTATNAMEGVLKAYGLFDGTGTPAFVSSNEVNFSSITDNSTGNYNLNFTNNMANANFTGAATSTVSTSTSPDQTRFGNNTTSYALYLHYDDEPCAARDVALNHALIAGDLA